MAKGLNRVEIIGHLGRDPEAKYTQGGMMVTSFTVAVNRNVREGDGWKEETEWVRCVAFDKLAETCNQWLRKGSKVYCAGRLQTRKWEQDGQTKYLTEVVLSEMIMLDGKSSDPETVPTHTGPRGAVTPVADVELPDLPF